MKKISAFVIALGVMMSVCVYKSEAQKKPLDHSVYGQWGTPGGYAVTRDGKYASYLISREEGDGTLNVVNLMDYSVKTIPRGNRSKFTPDGKFIVFVIRPFFTAQKEARIKKYKGDKVPADSLGIMELATGEITKWPFYKSYALPKEKGRYIAFRSRIMEDSLKTDGVFIYDLTSKSITDTIHGVDQYFFDKNGTSLYCLHKAEGKNKKGKNGISVYSLSEGSDRFILEGNSKTSFTNPVLSEDESRLMFYANLDTLKNFDENVEIYLYKTGEEKARRVVSNETAGLPEGWRISKNRSLNLSGDNKRLFFGISPVLPQKDTSLHGEEMPSLDVWHYNDKYIQPQQLKRITQDQRRSYLSYIEPDGPGKMIRLAKEEYPIVRIPCKWSAQWGYALSAEKYAIESQWNADPINDLYIISLKDGSSKQILDGAYVSSLESSPDGKYLTWFDPQQKNWFAYDVEKEIVRNVTENIPFPLWNELHDMPQMAPAYGRGGWRTGDEAFFVYDKYDVWEVDPAGIRTPERLTCGLGREKGYTFRMIRIDELQLPEGTPGIKSPEVKAGDSVYFTAFDNKSKGYGYYVRDSKGKKLQEMKELIMEPDYTLGYLNRSENGSAITFVKSNFSVSPDLWVTRDRFKTAVKISDSNPQQKQYNWGTCESVYWKSADGKEIEGLLYKPEDFDPAKKYPMVVYFYEKTSNYKNTYRKPAVSRSTINITYFVSNGYLVFMPDIHYIVGHPGKSAMNCIMPGVDKLCENSWVDKDNIAIQGQSWGGYQVAYIITQTDRFKCAGAGAPVANMTSAYGGIRWGSGVVRQFQYEYTQSRIGRTPWNKGGLELYLENSPLFFADRVKTPLLIMHNDADEAVPWYQGIEYFTALRRLGKQVWMLQYNGESHNIGKMENAKDYTIRLSQFMDHFLKGAPMPVWMKYGVPAIKKGIDRGLDIVEN